MYESKPYYYGTGRRKHSVARVRVYPGSGVITVNGRGIDDYFGLETLKLIVRQPLALTGTTEKFDIVCTVAGGGVTGQAGAIRHGLSRALLQYSDELRPVLKKAGFLTRDPRMKRSPVLKEIISALYIGFYRMWALRFTRICCEDNSMTTTLSEISGRVCYIGKVLFERK